MENAKSKKPVRSEIPVTNPILGSLALRGNPCFAIISGGTRRHGLTPERKQELQLSITDFVQWLEKRKKLTVQAAKKYDSLAFPRPTAADWIMRVKNSEVTFNSFIGEKSNFDYYRLVVLHECFHLFVQNVPNKSDAKRVKDDFGDPVMKLLDIEADYYSAMYYKEVLRTSLVELFSLFYLGSTIFGDPDIRFPKVERFIGSVLSIANAYFKNPGARQAPGNDLYLPTISNIPLEESIHVLIARDKHFAVGEIHADYRDFQELKKCYTGAGPGGIEIRRYVDTLINFASKALQIEIPTSVLLELKLMKSPFACA